MDIALNGINIQMLLYNRFENLDLFGPFDVFALAEKLQKLYERVAAKGKLGYIGGRRLKGSFVLKDLITGKTILELVPSKLQRLARCTHGWIAATM